MTGIRVHVHGAAGRMGSTCVEAVSAAPDMELVGATGRGDDLASSLAESAPEVVVEFTVPSCVESNLETILGAGVHAVSGTTGLTPERAHVLGELAERRGRGLLLAPNFAVGVLLLQRFAREAVTAFSDVEIIELHHEQKIDAPSGTALHTARLIADAARGPLNRDRPDAAADSRPGCRGADEAGIPVHSVRLPGLLAHQEVLFGGPGQLLTLRHDTLDRRAFMPGVLLGVRRIRERTGLVDSLEPLLFD